MEFITNTSSAHQEMHHLRNSWSVVKETDGWRVIPTRTIVVGRDETEIFLNPFVGRNGIDVFSILESEIGPRYMHHSYVPERGALGVQKVAHTALEVNKERVSQDFFRPRYHLNKGIALPVRPGQVLKVISRDVAAAKPHGSTELLLNVAMSHTEQYADVFVPQTVANKIAPYVGKFAVGHRNIDLAPDETRNEPVILPHRRAS